MEEIKKVRVEITCASTLKAEMEIIAKSEARSVASYIKGLILADMKKREV